MKEEEPLDELRRLIVGGTVERVEENLMVEGMITLHVRVAGVLWEVPLFATELGWWIRGVRALDGEVPTYWDARTMLKEMAEFGYADEDMDGTACVPLDSPVRREIGFRVTITLDGRSQSRDFWVPISRCTGSPWTAPLSTPEGRRWIAAHPTGPILWERADPRDAGRGAWEIEPWVDPAPGGTT